MPGGLKSASFEKIAWLLACILLSACVNPGPGSVSRDRYDYNKAVSDSWKQQALLNIVKIRYRDTPVFLDVKSLNQGYSLKGAVTVTNIESPKKPPDFSAAVTGSFSNKASISYRPIKGQQFTTSFMTPIPPAVILFLLQHGWPADLIMPLTLDSINGMRSQVAGGANQRLGDPSFYRVIEIIRHIQSSGEAGIQLERKVKKQKKGGEKEITLLSLQRRNLSPELRADLKEFEELLDIPPGKEEIEISYGLVPEEEGEISMLTHSMLGVLIQLAYQVDVPPGHIADKRTEPTVEPSRWFGTELARVIEIHNSNIELNKSNIPPGNAFAAVKYRNRWFWIDDRDYESKRIFTFVMILLSLAETGGKENLGVVTTPLGGQ